MFQFYLSSIKSIIGVCLKRGIFKFQFYLSSIKRLRTVVSMAKEESFNSTLVQLKVDYFKLTCAGEQSFNSTLVQLKAVKNANKYTSKSMIYHPFILIFYKHLQSTFNS